MKDLGDVLEDIGGISKYQVVTIFLGGLLALGELSLSSTYFSAEPKHRCSVPPVDVSFNLSESEIKNYTIPYNANDEEYSQCERTAYNLTYCNVINDINCITQQTEVTNSIKCDQGYRYDTDIIAETPVSEWNLVCDDESLNSLSTTLFFVGFFFGSFALGPISDWYGRKTALLISCGFQFVSCLVTSFMPSYASYVVLRIFVAAGSLGSYIAYFTYVSEIADSKWRTEAVMYININTAIAHSIYPWICKALREWRTISIVISLPSVPCFIILLFLTESPEWLLTKHRYDDAKKVVQRFAKSNNTKLNEDLWSEVVSNLEAKRLENKDSTREKINYFDLFRRPLMRLMCINTMYVWFTACMIFYGLSLNGGNLSGDFYMNNFLNAIVEIPGYFLVYFAGRFGRRPTLCVFFMAAGAFCLASMLSTELTRDGNEIPAAAATASTVLAIAGKLFATAVFALIYAVTSECFPSSARATAIGMGSMMARVGSMISPFAIQYNKTVPWFTQTLFGSLSILAGFTVLLYPETNGVEFVQTLDEAEQFYRDNLTKLPCSKRSDNSVEAYEISSIGTYEESNKAFESDEKLSHKF